MADCTDCGSLTTDDDFGGCLSSSQTCSSDEFYSPYPVDKCSDCTELDPYALQCADGLITECDS